MMMMGSVFEFEVEVGMEEGKAEVGVLSSVMLEASAT
jgi:hypothetical protein